MGEKYPMYMWYPRNQVGLQPIAPLLYGAYDGHLLSILPITLPLLSEIHYDDLEHNFILVRSTMQTKAPNATW